jgi:RNAse (barnase) inhibitor barstar
MSAHGFDLDLTKPTQSGVYFVGVDDLDRLALAAARDELRVCRIDLAGCHDKDELLQRLALSLQLPPTFGHNWDALADCLRDLGWMPAWGYVLLFEHAGELRLAAGADFNIPSATITTCRGSLFLRCPTAHSTTATCQLEKRVTLVRPSFTDSHADHRF